MTVLLLSEGAFIYPSVAAPAVKQLGTQTTSDTQQYVTKQTLTKLSTTNQSAPSVRALNLPTKSTINTSKDTKTVKTAQNTTNSTNTQRLPGLHGNLVKGISSKLSANSSPQPGTNVDLSDLTQRVVDLEEEILKKQEILEPGDGIDIDGQTISLSDEMMALPEKVDIINQEIATLNEKCDTVNLSDEYYTIDDIQQNYYTKESVDQIVGQLANADIADQFDPGFLHKSSENQQGI